MTAHEKMDILVRFFSSAARLARVTLETSFSPSRVPLVSHQNLGDSKRYGRNSFGVCRKYINFLEKVKRFKQFQAVLAQW